MLRRTVIVSLALALAPALRAQAVGSELSRWEPGTLEIHQISTGRGNSGLYIFPDGTTMLVDAGENAAKSARHTPDRPDGTRAAGEWIARYIRHALRHDPAPALDYVLLTHFHGDHMGDPSGSSRTAPGGYKLTGLAQVGDMLKIRKLLDRGWPDYRYPEPLADEGTRNYRAFAAWQMKNNALKVERFTPGRFDQVVLLRDPKNYADFQFRNIGANGEIWTGVGTATRQHFPELNTTPHADWPSENMCSTSFRVSYGKFDYFNGADIPGVPAPGYPVWQDVETPVAKAAGPVEAAILDHHGYIDTMNEFLVATLRPRVWTISVWDSGHPTSAVWQRLNSTRLYPGPRDIFATDVHPGVRAVINGMDKIASGRGHIVIRVARGGGEFRVVVVDDSNESHTVLRVFGPYECR
jgi:beta-lactamase superfamily II metal-dependent hydrolase